MGALVWPLLGILLLAADSLHPVWPGRAAKLAERYGSHAIYLGALGGTCLLLLIYSRAHPEQSWLVRLVRAALAVAGTVEGLKFLTRLPRPNGHPTGFPSGHTTAMFAVAWLLTRTHPRLAPLWYAVAVGVGWARMEGRAHFPYQVICGALIGAGIGLWAGGRGAADTPDEAGHGGPA